MKNIKKTALLSLFASFALAGASCQNMDSRQRATTGGAVIGAGAGAIIADDHPWKGAAIGGAAGAAGGYLFDKSRNPTPNPNP